MSTLVIPDWGALIALLPLLILIGVVGPFLTFIVLGWSSTSSASRGPRSSFEEGPRPAALDAAGAAVFPAGEPYCRRDGLIYPSGTRRCDRRRTSRCA